MRSRTMRPRRTASRCKKRSSSSRKIWWSKGWRTPSTIAGASPGRPGDARLCARVEALKPGGIREGRERGWHGGLEVGENVQAFLKRILAGRPGAPAPEVPPSGGGGRSPHERAFAVAPSDVELDPG